MKAFKLGSYLEFQYTNHRGETKLRRVLVMGVDFGENEWYPQPQWLLRCWDIERNDWRSFALSNIDTETLSITKTIP